MDHGEARVFAEQWVRDWNAHDIDALLKHFTDDIFLPHRWLCDCSAATG